MFDRLLVAALGCAGLPRPSYGRALWALRTWLDSWAGIGHVAIGMHRQGYDLPDAVRRPWLARDVLHERDGALADGRHRHRGGGVEKTRTSEKEEPMPRVKANGIEIEYEEFGASQDPLIVLIAGFGEQMGSVEFPSDFCQDPSSKGLRVVRFDNRDVGLSTHFTASVPESGAAPYTVVDMSDDVVGLVAALGVHATHLVGASLGGCIARWMAIRHPALAGLSV